MAVKDLSSFGSVPQATNATATATHSIPAFLLDQSQILANIISTRSLMLSELAILNVYLPLVTKENIFPF